MNVVSHHLSKAPVTVQGEGCSQGVVHHRAGTEVPSWKQAQEQNTDNPLAGPVERCSLGTRVVPWRQVNVLCAVPSWGRLVLEKC